MAKKLEVSEERLQHALRPSKQSFSVETALAIHEKYQVGLHFLFLGDIRELPNELLSEALRWVEKSRWSIEDGAPNFDRVRAGPGRPRTRQS